MAKPDISSIRLAAEAVQMMAPLQLPGSERTFQTMSEVDAKIAAAEARTDTKFAELMGELRAIEKSTAGIKTTVVVTGIAAVTLVVAIFGWGSQMFGTGMDVQSVSSEAARNVLQQAQPKFDAIDGQFQELTARYSDLNTKIGNLIDAIQKIPQQPNKQ